MLRRQRCVEAVGTARQHHAVLSPLYCPSAAGKHTADQRTAKWASAVLRQHEGDKFRFAYLHESPVPREQARA